MNGKIYKIYLICEKLNRRYLNKTILLIDMVTIYLLNQFFNKTLRSIVEKTVHTSTTIISDSFGAYKKLGRHYHHAEDEWVYGDYHTNTIEGFFSRLKRGIYGIYHSVSSKHLHRFCDEFSFKYNTRKYSEVERFDYSLFRCEED